MKHVFNPGVTLDEIKQACNQAPRIAEYLGLHEIVNYNPRHVPMIPLEGVPCIDYDTGKAWAFDLVFIHQTNGRWPIAQTWYVKN